jgi:magnesium transporter
MPVVESLDDHIEDVEQDIFNHPSPRLVSRIFRLRRKLLRFRRVLGAMREVANRLARDDYEVIDQRDRIYFRDVYDHLVRLFEIIEGMRDMVVGALDSYLSVSSNRINEVMRTLTIFTVLFMPISFLAGFFGMNFFGDQFAIANPVSANVVFWMCMILMVSIPPAMVWWMAKRGWLQPTIYGRVKEREQHALLEPRNHRNA